MPKNTLSFLPLSSSLNVVINYYQHNYSFSIWFVRLQDCNYSSERNNSISPLLVVIVIVYMFMYSSKYALQFVQDEDERKRVQIEYKFSIYLCIYL